MIGQTISHYRILEKLGQGGMGVVYKAEDTRLRRTVALKFLAPGVVGDQEQKTRFLHEAQAAAAFDHPNICTVYEIDETGGQIFIAMAYIEGQSVKEKIGAGPFKLSDCLDIVVQTAAGLQEAHQKNVVHRDIKSANLMITPRGQVKIMDFGLAQLAGETRLTRTGTTLGTPAYMSPEQARGERLDNRSDVWSLGVVLYEMITGQLPFRGGHGAAVVHSILHEAQQPITALRTGVPMELERIVNKALAKATGARYQRVEEMAIDLRAMARAMESGTTTAPAVKPAPPAVAVLPFADMSPQRDQEYFCDGITEEIISALTRIEGLRVTSRTSAFAFKGTRQDVRQIGAQLNAGMVLEGSVRKAGERLRISAQLTNVGDGYQVWSDRYDREMKDVFDIQDEISQAIVKTLRVKLLGGERAQLVKRPTENLEAYNLFLQGRHYWNRQTGESLLKAIGCYQQAVALDANFAVAYASLAHCYNLLLNWDAGPARELVPKVEAAVRKALEIDDTLADGHAALGLMRSAWQFEWEEGEQEYRRALDLNPGLADSSHGFAMCNLAPRGRFEEAVAQMRRARELDPVSPFVACCLGWALYLADRHEEAAEEYGKTLELDPNFWMTHWQLGLTACLEGKWEEGIGAIQRARELSGHNALSLGGLGWAYGVAGRRNEAQRLLGELQEASAQGRVSAYGVAMAHMGLGDHDRALEWLEKAYEQRGGQLYWIGVIPQFAPLRSDPRFQALLRRMRLA